MPRRSLSLSALAAALPLVVLTACGSGGGSAATTSTTASSLATASTSTVATTTVPAVTTTTVPAPSGPRAFAKPGPYPVGFTTLQMGDRPVAVWYPAVTGSEAGKAKATYDMRDLLPASEQAKVPDGVGSMFTMEAYADLPAAEPVTAPFPLVLFSHGLAGYRTQSSFLTAAMASWGFVVAAPEHRSRNLTSVLDGSAGKGQSDVEDLRATVKLMEAENLRDGGPFAGRVATGKVMAVGHSAGGIASFKLAADPDVVGYVELAAPPATGFGATTGTTVVAPAKPATIVAGSADAIARLDVIQGAFTALATSPKRLAVIDNATHLSFMDTCTIERDKGGVLTVARSYGVAVPDLVVKLFADGCDTKYLPAEQGWLLIEHLTIAATRSAFGIDVVPVGLDASIEGAYSPVKVTFTAG